MQVLREWINLREEKFDATGQGSIDGFSCRLGFGMSRPGEGRAKHEARNERKERESMRAGRRAGKSEAKERGK
eukprot:1485568-Rhodomonas_salina.1